MNKKRFSYRSDRLSVRNTSQPQRSIGPEIAQTSCTLKKANRINRRGTGERHLPRAARYSRNLCVRDPSKIFLIAVRQSLPRSMFSKH